MHNLNGTITTKIWITEHGCSMIQTTTTESSTTESPTTESSTKESATIESSTT